MEKAEIIAIFFKCAETNDFITWNKFRRKNRKIKIDFSGESLHQIEISKFNLNLIAFDGASLRRSRFDNCNFNNATFVETECFGAHFNNCAMVSNHFTKANLSMAVFDHSDLRFSTFEYAKIHQVKMLNCQGYHIDFFSASFNNTDLSGSNFKFSNLSSCDLSKVELRDVNFEAAVVDGKTIVWDCYYNVNTNFTGVGLSSCRIEPVLMSSFQCNIRRMWWMNWYKENMNTSKEHLHNKNSNWYKKIISFFKYIFKGFSTAVVKGFWWITDYGSSTVRLLMVFLALTLFFTAIYSIFPHLTNDVILNESTSLSHVLVRALYFSIVVNTGLGFGEINASEMSYAGHFIISMHSLIGFILLGAFLVRIGILFQGEFPVAKERLNTIIDFKEEEYNASENNHH